MKKTKDAACGISVKKPFKAMKDVITSRLRKNAKREGGNSISMGKTFKSVKETIASRLERTKSSTRKRITTIIKKKANRIPNASTLPQKFLVTMKAFNGRDIQWMDRIDVVKSDVSSGRNRLFLPREVEHVLTAKEKSFLKKDIENSIKVLVVDDYEDKSFMWVSLKYWPSMEQYVLTNEWFGFVQRNQIQADVHQLEVWSFRAYAQEYEDEEKELKLCFAIDIRGKATLALFLEQNM